MAADAGVAETRRAAARPIFVANWYRIPLPLRQIVLAAIWSGYGIFLLTANAGRPQSQTYEFVIGVCAAGLALSIAADILTPTIFGSLDELRHYSSALRTGTLPDGIDHFLWRRRLMRSQLTLIAIPWIAAVVLGIGIFSANSITSPTGVALQCALALAGLGLLVLVVRRGSRVAELRSELNRRTLLAYGADKHQTWLMYVGMSPALRFAARAAANWMTFLLNALVISCLIGGRLAESHFISIALGSAGVGLLTTYLQMFDPRRRATADTVQRVVDYDRSWRRLERPARFDVDDWRRWLGWQRQADRARLPWVAFFYGASVTCALNQNDGVAALLGLMATARLLVWGGTRSTAATLARWVREEDVRRLYG